MTSQTKQNKKKVANEKVSFSMFTAISLIWYGFFTVKVLSTFIFEFYGSCQVPSQGGKTIY
jgi:hypothetical protein